MIHIEGDSADAVWRQVAERLRSEGALQESRDQPTRELLHVALTITDPRQRLVFVRPMNPAFALAEMIWMLAGANDVSFLRFWNPRMARYADDADPHRLHGAYGYRLGSQPRLSTAATTRLRHEPSGGASRLDQLKTAYEALQRTPHSRQVVLQFWDADRDLPAPEPRSRDVPCNLVSHLMVRDGRLEWLQVMRSNDLMWGLPYNIVQFTSLQEIMAGCLGVDVGTYTHLSDSLHIYQRHWPLLEVTAAPHADVPRNAADVRIASYAGWEQVWARLVDTTFALSQRTDTDSLLAAEPEPSNLPTAYAEWMGVLTAEALRRRKHYALAEQVAIRAGPFWGASWHLWRARQQGAGTEP